MLQLEARLRDLLTTLLCCLCLGTLAQNIFVILVNIMPHILSVVL